MYIEPGQTQISAARFRSAMFEPIRIIALLKERKLLLPCGSINISPLTG